MTLDSVTWGILIAFSKWIALKHELSPVSFLGAWKCFEKECKCCILSVLLFLGVSLSQQCNSSPMLCIRLTVTSAESGCTAHCLESCNIVTDWDRLARQRVANALEVRHKALCLRCRYRDYTKEWGKGKRVGYWDHPWKHYLVNSKQKANRWVILWCAVTWMHLMGLVYLVWTIENYW